MTQKQCYRCKAVKPLSEFYRHSQMADGHLNQCKECSRAVIKANRRAKAEQYSRYEAERKNEPRRRDQMHDARREHRRKYPDKARARTTLARAVRAGKVVPQPCVYCGSPHSEGHHHDYSKPLDVTWACFKCHREREHGQAVVSEFERRRARKERP